MSQSKAQLTNPLGPVNLSGLNATGVITATTFLGDGTALTGIALTGNINTTGIITASSFSGSGTNLTGVQIGATANINTSGIITAASFSGNGVNLTGVGLGPNDSASTTGIVTASKFVGSGIGLTNVGGPIGAVIFSPASGATGVVVGTAITITFSKPIQANSGTITLRSGSASGTIVESFDVTSSNRLTISTAKLTIDPTSDLSEGTVYYVVVPAGAFKDTYVGISSNVLIDNYSFTSQAFNYELWSWGSNNHGQTGINTVTTQYSSPVQIPGTQWSGPISGGLFGSMSRKTDGTLWSWGYNDIGFLGQNDTIEYSSPVQIPGTQWDKISGSSYTNMATKTDGTLWMWGRNQTGELGQNNKVYYSSPIQIPGTQWNQISIGRAHASATKTDGTLWVWGYDAYGQIGQNTSGNYSNYSSPTQIPGTQWSTFNAGYDSVWAFKTDGTLWVWGRNGNGQLGQNNTTPRSSPVQIPGTQWNSNITNNSFTYSFALLKTDGTLWSCGINGQGRLGHNDTTPYSSPRQIPGTQWSSVSAGYNRWFGLKTDNTLWTWGDNTYGNQGTNNTIPRSSPVQIPGTQWYSIIGWRSSLAIKKVAP